MHLRARFAVVLSVCAVIVTDSRAEDSPAVSSFLTNMPQNSDKRCVGIAGVAEALLDGEPVTNLKMSPAELAQEIYKSFTSGKTVRYPSQLNLAGKRGSIEIKTINNKAVLEALSTRVADLYKADFLRMRRTPAGIKKLFAAEELTVKTRDELEQLLQAEPDKIGFFCCFGTRTFPDGKISQTSHAVLLQLMPHDVIVVYDPNDPDHPVECALGEEDLTLLLSWQCQYRDQNLLTTQYYDIVPQSRFFRALQ